MFNSFKRWLASRSRDILADAYQAGFTRGMLEGIETGKLIQQDKSVIISGKAPQNLVDTELTEILSSYGVNYE